MKATDLLKLIENSKSNKSVPGELGKQSYQNDNTPNNHVNGKSMKQVTAKAGGEKNDKKPRADVGSPKKREKRSMEGPGTSARRMNEALSAQQIGKLIRGTSRDASTGMQAIQLNDVNRGQDISVPMSDPKIYRALLTAIKSGDDNLANRAYSQLINSPNASLSSGSSFRDKEVGAMERGAHSGGAMQSRGGSSTGRAMSQDEIDRAGSKFSLASGKGSPERRIRENNNSPEGWAEKARAAQKAGNWAEAEGFWKKAASASTGHKRRARYEDSAARAHAKHGGDINESGAERGDSMGKEKAAACGPVSKSATVKTRPFDKKPTADVGKVKGKEKRSMGENPAPVKDCKGGENQHKSMKKMHEAISDLSTWLGSDLNLMENELETFYLDSDQPATCPHCGSRTDFQENPRDPNGPQHHKCMNKKCGFEFMGEFKPEGEFDEAEGDYMDRKKKIAGQKDKKPIKSGAVSTRSSPGKGYRR